MLIKLHLPDGGPIQISPKGVFKLYLQYKQHFAGKYDVVKYGWRMTVSDKAFESRRDKFFFKQLAEKFNLQQLSYIFVSNLSSNQDSWIGDISDADAISHYKKYVLDLRTMTDVFTDDVKNIYLFYQKLGKVNKFKNIFIYNDEIKSTYVLKLLQTGIISLETFMLLDSIFNLIEQHDEHTNILWERYSIRLKAYKKLLIINKPELLKLFKQVLADLK